MLIELDLNTNDAESLLRHCTVFQTDSGDCREDSRLADALTSLAFAVKDSMSAKHPGDDSVTMVDPRVLEVAIGLFQDKDSAVRWLFRPLRALGDKRPVGVPIDEALALIARLEHGICC